MGQVCAVLACEAPGIPVVDLLSDVPPFRPHSAAYLLAAFTSTFPRDTVFLCVVDPGVGTTSRAPAVVNVDDQWFVGPNNGLFNIVARRGSRTRWWTITWRPQHLSNTFHGRDLFAPVAARIARGEAVPGEIASPAAVSPGLWPEELYEVVYIDHFGNAMTGIRAQALAQHTRLLLTGIEIIHGRTYADFNKGQPFWYENANGLVEIAINQGSAARYLGIEVGAPVRIVQ